MNAFISGALFFGSGLAFLFALSALLRQPRAGGWLYLSAFFSCIGLFQLHDFLFFSGVMVQCAQLSFYNVPLLFAAGPLLYMYFAIMLGRPGSTRLTHRGLHLLPVSAICLLLLPFYTQDAAGKLAALASAYALQHPPLIRGAYLAALLSVLLYGLAIAYRLRHLWSLAGTTEASERRQLRAAAAVLGLFLLAVVLAIPGFWLRSIAWIIAGSLLVNGILALIYLLNQQDPGLMEQLSRTVVRQRYEKSRLKNLDLDAIAARLKQLMDIDQVYCEDELKLSSLAQRLQITPHQLSQYLNEYEQKNFNTFINEYRIAEAQRLLLSEPRRTVLSIAYAVGFNSNSVFHEAFVKITGQPPGRFRKKNLPKL